MDSLIGHMRRQARFQINGFLVRLPVLFLRHFTYKLSPKGIGPLIPVAWWLRPN